MKKQYIAPAIKVRRIQSDALLAATSGTFSLSPTDGDPETNSDGTVSVGAKSHLFDDGFDNGGINWDDEQ